MKKIPNKEQARDVAFVLTTTAKSLEGLVVTISSVLSGQVLPGHIFIRFEGALPSFGSFYLEQLAAYAKTLGVGWSMVVDKSRGIRYARDWLLQNVPYPYLWMGDDDVLFDSGCLAAFSGGVFFTQQNPNTHGNVVAFAGIKVDAVNRRGYPDYDTQVHTKFDSSRPCCLNHYYEHWVSVPHIRFLDTGNCFLNREKILGLKAQFQLFPDSVPDSGGEDTLFAENLVRKGGQILPIVAAHACHLEKPKVIFNDISARAELVRRSVSVLDQQV